MSKIPLFKDPESWQGMRNAGQLVAKTFDFIKEHVKEGVSTEVLNQLCHSFILDHGGYPAPLEVGFPKAVCISRNHVICHGVPDKEVLKAGDIVGIDISLRLEGWYGDSCRMFCVGTPSAKAQELVQTCHQALEAAIALVKPGVFLGDIGFEIQSIAESKGFSVVRDFCGHGIGRVLHGAPEVCHVGQRGQGVRLQEGMFFTIEPMINMGTYKLRVLSDDWTVVTQDGRWSAQWEHTLGVNAQGCEVFTRSEQILCQISG